MEFKSKPFTPEMQQWIAAEEEISRRENLTYAIEAQTAAIEAQTAAILAAVQVNKELASANDYLAGEISTLNERLAPCDFTNWPLSMCISNLVAVLEQKGVK